MSNRARGGEIPAHTPTPGNVAAWLSPGGWTGCTDSAPESTWSCIEYDGTGLWCDACKTRAELLHPTNHQPRKNQP